MRALWISLTIFIAWTWAAGPVSAQQAPQTVDAPPPAPTPPPGGVITTAPSLTYANPAYFEYDLEEAKERSRRTRVALIATSAVFGVGAIIAGIGASQCESRPRINQTDEWVCNNAGDVMVPLGGTMAGLAAIGMITSGAMLGVRNRNKREIERDLRRRYYGSRFRWDVESGRFVF
jgi:hypothetical protein